MLLCLLVSTPGAGQPAPTLASADASARASMPRLISLNPSLTAIAFRLGAGEAIIGVDDYSARVVPEAADRPRVGGLFDPSLEAVVALQPDRVLIVAGVDQQTHAERLERLGLEVDIYQNERLDQVLENIERLGRLLDREREAAARIEEILETRRAVAMATRGRVRPKTVAIVDRSPLYLVGAETFLDELLAAVGAENLGRGLAAGYPRGSIEWLIAARPELLIDMTPGSEEAAAFWSRWPSLPAVAAGRAITVEASRVSMPGPDLDLALRELARVVHGVAIDVAIDGLLREWASRRSAEATRP
jgi:iron complex transport system substrate-binding protein